MAKDFEIKSDDGINWTLEVGGKVVITADSKATFISNLLELSTYLTSETKNIYGDGQ